MDLIHLLTVSRQQFAPAEVKTTARRLKDKYVGTGRRFLIEVSGGLTEQNISAHLCDGKPEAQSNNQTFLLHPREFAHQLELLFFFFYYEIRGRHLLHVKCASRYSDHRFFLEDHP